MINEKSTKTAAVLLSCASAPIDEADRSGVEKNEAVEVQIQSVTGLGAAGRARSIRSTSSVPVEVAESVGGASV